MPDQGFFKSSKSTGRKRALTGRKVQEKLRFSTLKTETLTHRINDNPAVTVIVSIALRFRFD